MHVLVNIRRKKTETEKYSGRSYWVMVQTPALKVSTLGAMATLAGSRFH